MGEIFERAIPDLPLEWTGERMTNAIVGQIEVEHLHRYFIARDLCRNLDVLDIACGEGYGSALLAQVAKSVVGIDISDQAVAHAECAYSSSNLRYQQGDARVLPFPDSSLDVVVSFETLEHFYEHDQFLAEVRRVLRPAGRLILSSPDRDLYSPAGSQANPYHVRELSRIEFERLLTSLFAHTLFLSQRTILGSALIIENNNEPSRTLTFEQRGERFYEASQGLPRSPYIVAVASEFPLENIPNSLFIKTDEIHGALLQIEAQKRQDSIGFSMEELSQRLQSAKTNNQALTHEIDRFKKQAQTYESNAQQAMEIISSLNERIKIAEEQRVEAIEHDVQDIALLKAQLQSAESNNQALTHQIDRLTKQVQIHEGNAQRTVEIISSLNERIKIAEEQRVEAIEQGVRDAALLKIQLQSADNKLSSLQTKNVLFHRLLRKQSKGNDYNYAMGMQISELESERKRLATLLAQANAHCTTLEQEKVEWQQKYFALRERLIAILHRYGLVYLSRLMPRPFRSFVRNRMLGGPKS